MWHSLRVGFFLAVRYVRHASVWTTLLIVAVMMFTFLNLIVVTGVLVGLVEGSEAAFSEQYSGDVLIERLPSERYIENSDRVRAIASSLEPVAAFSPRYIERGTLEADYKRSVTQRDVLPDTVGAAIAGIDPSRETQVTSLREIVVEGRFLRPEDNDRIVLGSGLLSRYMPGQFGQDTLSDVAVGDELLLTVNGTQEEVTVAGIVESKTNNTDRRIYMLDTKLRQLIGRFDYNVDEIAIKAADGAAPETIVRAFENAGVTDVALVRTAGQAAGEFIDEIRSTFKILGNVIGGISLIVASITIFIVVFITAITRQQSIGILKAVGISNAAIEISYVLLSLFYSTVGLMIGITIVYAVLVPYFQANPIDFPFSDGVLAVSAEGTVVRVILVLLTTLIAGYVPARLVVGKPTLDAILGR
jgi:ABC-type lipoprotein release transport system permease subunit